MSRRVVVRTAGPSGFRNGIAIGEHRLESDEPPADGGGDAGPAPFELLMAALGACISMTLRGYAARKGWDLRSVEVAVEREKLDPGNGPENAFRVEVRLEGDLDEERRGRLQAIAGRCPVHRTLVHGARVTTVAV